VNPTISLPELITLGRRHRVAGELDEAMFVFTRGHEMFPDAARPLIERGAVLILQQRYDESRADYSRATELEPDYPGLRSYVAELDLYTDRAAEALALSTAGAQDEPDNLTHRLNIAHALLLLGRTDEAVDAYRSCATQLHPVKQRTGADLALQDLRLLAEAHVDLPGVDRARAALSFAPTTRSTYRP
jgi:tetratricopeptide (TPR) repeat protein